MSEYWKSTPKYWCDHCHVYVRDTKLEKTNHESTGKHQNNLAKFLRNLHKDNEREEREQQFAKNEVARLKGTGESSTDTTASAKATASATSGHAPRQATAEERKRQIAQLAAMGVAVPEQYRKDMAMAGEWETVSSKPASRPGPTLKREEGDAKLLTGIGGIKRTMPDSGLDEEEPSRKRIVWGSTTKTYKDSSKDDELEALLGSTASLPKKVKVETEDGTEVNAQLAKTDAAATQADDEVDNAAENIASNLPGPAAVKPEAANDDTDVVFKKRKSKAKR